MKMPKVKIGTAILGVIGILIILPVIGIWSIVGAGNVGVVTRFGAVNRVATPGIILKIPLIEYVHAMETRTQKEQADASSASKDLQEVKATIALNYHLRGEKAVEVYQNIGTDYKIRVIDPAMQEAFKATTAKFTAEELIGKREAVKQEALNELKDRLNHYNVIVDNFNIINFDFSTEFNQAIEQKQVAQQNLERAKLEAQTAKTQAEGQAQAQKALRDAGSLSSEYLEFLALQKWNGVLPTVTGNGVPFINIPVK
jgi:regulator of protease activity HflC (stomatin/prohibitin superfamily)